MKNLIYLFLLFSFFSYSQVEISLHDFALGNYPIDEKLKIYYNNSKMENQYFGSLGEIYADRLLTDSLFYREVTFKSNNIPKGPIKDYYMNGDLMTLFYSDYLGLNSSGEDSVFFNGPIYNYFKKGNKRVVAYFLNNVLEAEINVYYESGKVELTVNFINGIRNGRQEYYNETYPFLQPKEVWPFENGIYNGMAQSFYENGEIESEVAVKDGKVVGPEIGYYENGIVEYKTIYKDGKAGNISMYYDTGEKQSTSEWIQGDKHLDRKGKKGFRSWQGDRMTFYKSGIIKSKKIYSDNWYKAKKIIYYESGEELSKVNYINDLIQGEKIRYYETGEVEFITNYVDDLRQGLRTYFSKNGEVDYDELYLDDKRVDRKIALVIGNAAYEKGPLENPVNDANLIAESLEKLDFDVELYNNLSSRDEMLDAIKDFGRKRNNYEVAFVYYAGHGIQLNNENYLLPVNEEFEFEDDVEDNGVSMQRVLRYLESTRENQLNFIVLDACRDNPFESNWNKTRSLKGAGLAKTPPPTGSLIAFSTDHGQTAADGDGGNSLYSLALAEKLLEENVSIEQVFKNVRTEVLKLSGDTQSPVEESKLTGDAFYLNKTNK